MTIQEFLNSYSNSNNSEPASGNNFVQTSSAKKGKLNPAPESIVPGARTNSNKGKTYTGTATQIQALVDMLPYYTDALQAAQTDQAGVDYNLFSQYAPLYDAIGQQLNANSAASDLKISKESDPEYYSTRTATADAIAKLLASINLDSGLSGGETSAIERSLNQDAMRRGTLNSASNLDTVGNAIQYGGAARARENENKSILSNAISTATNFMPTAKTNIGVGKTNNTGMLAAGAGNSAQAGGQNVFGQIGNNWNVRSQIGANNQSFGDILGNSFAGSLGSSFGQAIGGGVGGGLMALCWIAREVYGESNPKWLEFRQHLLTKADPTFFYWYLRNGEEAAAFIKDKPHLKQQIRQEFDKILLTQ